MTISVIISAIGLLFTVGYAVFSSGRLSGKVDELIKDAAKGNGDLEKKIDANKLALEEKIAEHRATDDKQFEKYNEFHKSHFDRFVKLEIWQSGQIEKNISSDKWRDEVRNELKEIKQVVDDTRNLMMKLYDSKDHS